MIDYSNRTCALKLTDYGLGKVISPTELTNKSYGSLAYSSPEIVSGEYYSFETDIWSIGMLIYFIYSSSDPFSNIDIDIREVKEMIMSANIKWLYSKLPLDSTIIHLLDACFRKTNRGYLKDLYIV